MAFKDNVISAEIPEQIKSILVVEDNTALRFTLSEWLRALKYTVYEAGDADEAVMLLASPLSIHLVVTDVEMPGSLNGFGLAEHIRANKPVVDIIVVSGNSKVQKNAGDIVFLAKPYDFNAMAQRIKLLFQKS